MPDKRERRPHEETGAHEIGLAATREVSTPAAVVAFAPSCPVACSTPCTTWRCPIHVGDALDALVDALVGAS